MYLSWKKEQASKQASKQGPISFCYSCQTRSADHFSEEALETTLTNAKVAYFLMYHLRYVFCTRLIARERVFEVSRDQSKSHALACLRKLRRRLPPGFVFDREEVNVR
jgi:hypothetical protein